MKVFNVNKKKPLAYAKGFGAEGGDRTHTVLPPREFESRTSANSITSAHYYLKIISYISLFFNDKVKRSLAYANDLFIYLTNVELERSSVISASDKS